MTWIDTLASFFTVSDRNGGMFEVDWTHKEYRISKDSIEEYEEAKRNAEETYQNYIQQLKKIGLPIDEKFEEEERKYFLGTVDYSLEELDKQLEMLVGHPKPVSVKLLEKMRNVGKMRNVFSSKEDVEVTELV